MCSLGPRAGWGLAPSLGLLVSAQEQGEPPGANPCLASVRLVHASQTTSCRSVLPDKMQSREVNLLQVVFEGDSRARGDQSEGLVTQLKERTGGAPQLKTLLHFCLRAPA